MLEMLTFLNQNIIKYCYYILIVIIVFVLIQTIKKTINCLKIISNEEDNLKRIENGLVQIENKKVIIDHFFNDYLLPFLAIVTGLKIAKAINKDHKKNKNSYLKSTCKVCINKANKIKNIVKFIS